jgi:hypothetical protein
MTNNETNERQSAGSPLRRILGQRWLFPSVAGALLLLLAASVPGYHLHIDEGWIGEQAYVLARDGYVHSNLFEGFAANDLRIVVYHRLFVLLGSWAVALFGWSIGSLRVVPLLSGALLLCAIGWYMRRRMGASRETTAITIALFLLMPLNFTYIKVYRPEMLMALCGFAGYICLTLHLSRRRWYLAAAAAIAGTSAALAHPYGAIFPVASMIILLLTRDWRGAATFLLSGALPAIPYAIDIATHIEIFRAQISNQFVAEKTSFTILTPLLNLLNEHKRLFRKAETILPTILLIISLIVNARRSAPERRLLQRYTILLVILLGALAQDKVTRYAIPLLPFFAIEIGMMIGEWVERPERYGRICRWGLGVAMALFVGFGVHAVVADLGAAREQVADLNAAIASSIPPGTRCLAPVNFLFDEITRYPIVGLRYANMEHANRLTMAEAIDFADRHHTDAIIVNRYATLDEMIVDLDSAATGEFAVAARTGEYTVLRRRGE